MKQLSEEAKKVIRIGSVSVGGNEELANFLASLLKDRGLKTITQQVTHSLEAVSKRQFNVIGILGDPLVDRKTRKGLLLASQLDTLPPGLPVAWVSTDGNPFSATFHDGRVHGLGTASGKLDFLCKLRAVERFRERKLRMPIYLVGTCGDELGMLGTRYLIKSLALNPKRVLVGAPTGLRVVHAHKSHLALKVAVGFQQVEKDAKGFNRRVDLVSFGRAARSSEPDSGVNAASRMLRLLDAAVEAGFELRFSRLAGGDGGSYDPALTASAVGPIPGAPIGALAGKVPDLARTEFYLTSHQFEEFKRFFRETIQAQGLEKAFHVELGGLGNMGVRFLPDVVFRCVCAIARYFEGLAEELEAQPDGAYQPACSTVSLGALRQGQGSLELLFDLNLIENGGNTAERLRSRVAAGLQELGVRYPSVNLTVSVERSSPALVRSPEDEWVRTCQEAQHEAGIPAVLDRHSSATAAALYAQAGYDAVAFGPGPSLGNVGGPEEHNLVEQMESSIAFYEKAIEKTCL
jgi:acetylornithine deacetylase/succinyl-diaminopimelate desuccinylase-like protein